MRTNIDLDAGLMDRAMAITGLSTPQAVVEAVLRRFVSATDQKTALAEMHGPGWNGDPDALRETSIPIHR